MLLAYKKLPIRVSKFFKVILPKLIYTKANFEYIKTNIINHQVIYQLFGLTDMVIFYKKANINVYNSLKDIKNHITSERLKVNITPNHVVYAHEGYDFVVYLADEFIFIVHSKDDENDNERWVLDILVYNVKLNILSKYRWDFDKSYYGIYGFRYLRKCKKVILTVGKPALSDEVFHKTHDIRRGFDWIGFYVI
jgi:hypothetical protein